MQTHTHTHTVDKDEHVITFNKRKNYTQNKNLLHNKGKLKVLFHEPTEVQKCPLNNYLFLPYIFNIIQYLSKFNEAT